jgi:hypothetical protein
MPLVSLRQRYLFWFAIGVTIATHQSFADTPSGTYAFTKKAPSPRVTRDGVDVEQCKESSAKLPSIVRFADGEVRVDGHPWLHVINQGKIIATPRSQPDSSSTELWVEREEGRARGSYFVWQTDQKGRLGCVQAYVLIGTFRK